MPNRLETRFTRDYGVQYPGIAMSEAGGVGSLAVGPLPAETVRSLIKAFKGATSGPLNVNFITILTQEAQILACIDEGVSIVSFHWGPPPRGVVARLHDAGIKVWDQVGSVDAAKQAVDSGMDLIIAQGSEAGGHNYGSLPTFVLVPSILEAVVPMPVLAAIATGRQLAAVLVLGADGVSKGEHPRKPPEGN